MLRSVLAFLVLLLAVRPAGAESVHFPSLAVGRVDAGPEISGWLYWPSGPGPFPAIVLAHSCAGVNRHTDEWGKRLAGWGYVVLAPDSFGPRGVTSVCGRGRLVNGNMRVADVAGAIDFLQAQPFVERNRIGLIGHSHGGWTTMRAVQKGFGLANHGLRAAVAYYPLCWAALDYDVSVPLLVLIGEQDDWTPAQNCRRLQQGGFTHPELVEMIYYPHAFHSFDANVRDRYFPTPDGQYHRLAYDPVAAADAEARTKAFFDRLLKQ
ncbi:Dienelactone hydrolase [Enhydrobacter aerosaccus]|uniref:Dienelactone hydrolase n=1 Tax=Enhydrobacter aerosaccus TaxID=225324 RepID=A0A1T4MWP2_9HYPH|nr:dienelactone hydrolase family protein [Enhydrobacter aerosaccus]SJZ71432.1 Dienelactone hydrolase [Enhydrobacter aerosaccus]